MQQCRWSEVYCRSSIYPPERRLFPWYPILELRTPTGRCRVPCIRLPRCRRPPADNCRKPHRRPRYLDE